MQIAQTINSTIYRGRTNVQSLGPLGDEIAVYNQCHRHLSYRVFPNVYRAFKLYIGLKNPTVL